MRVVKNNIFKYSIFIVFLFINIGTSFGQNSCYGATGSDFLFTTSIETQNRNIQIPSGCNGGAWTIISYPSWLTSATISGTKVYATAPAYSGSQRDGSIYLANNGNSVGGIKVYQNKGVSPPPPPSCSITGFLGSNFAGAGQTKNYTLTYSNCPANVYFTFKQVVNGVEQNLPSWVSVSQSSSTQISVTFAQNSGTSSRNIILIGKRQDGGSPGIGGTFTQSCFQKTWYADSDNDGFRNPGSTGVLDCANRGTGWTLNTTVDNCPNNYSTANVAYTWYPDADGDGLRNPTGSTVVQCTTPSGGPWTKNTTVDVCPTIPNTLAENVLKNWYQDTDGDHYPDPNAQVVQQCTKPSGGWTSTPQQFTDLCPTQAYSANGSNGCNPQCLPYTINPGTIEFPEGGGTNYATINFGCTTGYAVEIGPIPNNSDNWLSITRSGTQLTITCQAGASEKIAQISIKINGQSQGGITVKRNYIPPPPPPCIITGFSGSEFLKTGETKEYTLSYSDCPSDIYYTFKKVVNGVEQNLDPWITVSQPSSTKIFLTFAQNDEPYARNITFIGKRQDGGSPGIGGTFTQPCIEKAWYADSDNDGFRDPNSTPIMDCAYRGLGWTLNTDIDNCPNVSSNSNGGCPIPDPDCATFTVSPDSLVFGEQGGNNSTYVSVSPDCTDSISVTYSNSETWLTINVVGTQIQVTCDATTVSRSANISVFVNGNSGGGFVVTQNYTPPPPPPPPSCDLSIKVDGVSLTGTDVNYGINADTKTIQVVFDPIGCEGEVTFGNYLDGGPLDNSITVGPNQGNNTFNFSTLDNNSGISKTVYVGVYSYVTGDYLGLFRILQISCTDQEWYPDTDGDGSGDANAVPRYGCSAPTDQTFIYVGNNRDLCPNDAGLAQNNGCPEGQNIENRNTITTWAYDLNDVVKASSKSYFDDLGKLEQTQSWDIKSDSIWAAASLYDEYGRSVIQTLSAPIREGLTYQFKEGFIKKEDNSTDFNIQDYSDANVENPSPVGNAVGTLGWYYSESNNHEEYQDITSHPYAKSVYSTLNPGAVLKTVGGNKINGEWPQGYSFAMVASNELSESSAFGDVSYNGLEITKRVSRDVHGVENVMFTDTDGKVLASARSGSEGQQSAPMTVAIPEQGFVDIHIAEGINGFTISNAGAVTVYDLISESIISGSTSAVGKGFYRVAVNDLENYFTNSIGVTYTVNYYDYSLNEYDKAGRLVKSYQPLGATKATKLFTTYEYNTLGQLQRTTSPDEGVAEFKYRDDGQIRFSQNSKQKDPNEDGNFADEEFSYTNYDTYGRPVESGVYAGGALTFGTVDPILENVLENIIIDDDGLDNASCTEQTFTLYDEQDTAAMHAALAASGIPTTTYLEQGFVSGNVSKTYRVDAQMATTTWYSYDVYGRVNWIVQNLQGLGTKTIDYTYDPITGSVLMVDYQKDTTSERFVHRYTYNVGDQLTKVETSINGTNFVLNAEYEYYETGALKRTELAGGVQGIDYVYNLLGQLKSLNHPSLSGANDPGGDTNDLFGMQIDYNATDYNRTSRTNISSQAYGIDQLNGNIKGIRWKNDAVPGSTNELMYAYEYDRNSWLKKADFTGDGTIGGNEPPLEASNIIENGQTLLLENPVSITLKDGFHAKAGSTVTARIVAGSTGSAIADGDYDVSNITYDANGNILSLKRNKQTQSSTNAMDDLSYSYETGTNKLLQVQDAAGDVALADDIENQPLADNYKYNKIGQLVENKAEGVTYTYNTSGLVTEIKRNGLSLVTFFYNDRNHRVRKDTYNGSGQFVVQTTHYVRDAAGSVLGIYTNNALEEQPVYGNGRIAVTKRASNTSYYELADHLGNVRAAFTVSNGTTNTQNGTDYYPFGMQMPGRGLNGGAYRYAFQGQEKDDETSKEAFELRLWDSRIGRWLTTDPAGQFASPYIGMGNNPIRMIDPDGGTCYDPQGNVIDCGEDNSNFEGSYKNLVSGDNFVIGTDHTRQFYNALDEVVVTAPSNTNGNLALTGNLLGTTIGLLDEHSLFQAQKGIPKGKFAVNFNGRQSIWSESFRGGTRANISSEFVNAARSSANSARTVSKVAGYANFVGSVLGYYGAVENLYNGNYRGAVTEAVGNRLSILAAAEWGNAYGIAWTVGWEAGKVHGHILDENIPGYVRYFKNPLRETFGFEPIPLPR